MPRSASWWWSGIFWREPPADERGAEARDGRGVACAALGRAAMRAARDQPLGPLLPADRRERGDAGADASAGSKGFQRDRRGVPGVPVLRLAADGAPPAPAGAPGRPRPGGPADAPDGPGRDLSEAKHQRPASGAPGLSLPAAGPCDRAAQPGLVLGHHLHRYVRRTSRFGEARLARPAGAWPGQGGSACPVSTKSRIWPTFWI